MNNQEKALRAMADEAIRTHAERVAALEPMIKHREEAGHDANEIKQLRTDYMRRTELMARIIEVLEASAMGARQVGDGADLVSYQGEVMLSNWSETAAAGRKVEFWLPEGADAEAEHPFKYYTRRLRGSPGTRFQMVLVEIDDEDQPVPRGTGEAKPRLSQDGKLVGGAIAKHAGRLCKDSDFHLYLEAINVSGKDDSYQGEELATDYVRVTCGVDSRALLDHDREAQLRYERKIVSPFNQWLEREEGPAI